MLGKIIKHEFKATYQGYLLLFGAFFAVTLLTKFSMYVPLENTIWDILQGILLIAWVLLLVFLVMAAMVMAVVRFYKTMVKDEGYLTHTIPVKKSQLLIGKCIVAFVWIVVSVIVMLLSIFVFAVSTDFMYSIKDGCNYFAELISQYPQTIGHLLLALLMAVLSVMASIMMFYASIALGQMFSGHKFAGAVVFYFVINYAFSFLSSLMMFIMPGFIDKMEATDNMDGQELLTDGALVFDEFMLMMIALEVAAFVVFFAIANWRFSKKLNLD